MSLTERLRAEKSKLEAKMAQEGREDGARWAQQSGAMETLHALSRVLERWERDEIDFEGVEQQVKALFSDHRRDQLRPWTSETEDHPYWEEYLYAFMEAAVGAYNEALNEM